MSLEHYGSYELIKRLATGGMAQIYLAREPASEKLLVVKRILPHLAENVDFVRMFLDEARIAARLHHPNIVQIFNLGAQDDSYFIAMEYIHGDDVRRVWKRAHQLGREMPVPLVCRVVMEACAGLDYAHKKADGAGKPLDIVHRDVSPQNILVTFDGAVKVVDFGIAKAADQATITRSGVLKGKYSYMSPEQSAGRRLDRRSDIFALGVVLWELLTGNRLFKRANDIQTLNAVSDCEVEPPSSVNPALPKDLDAVVLKALAKTPEGRYPDAAALRDGLERWLAKHQLNASSAQLATFMQGLYAERLAAEKEAGRVLVDELDGPRPDEPEPAPRARRDTPRRAPSPLPPPVGVDPLDVTAPPDSLSRDLQASLPQPSVRGDLIRMDPPGVAGLRELDATFGPNGEPAPADLTLRPVDPDVTDRPHEPPPWSVPGPSGNVAPADGSALGSTEGPALTMGPVKRARIALLGLAAAVILGVSAGGLYVWRKQPSQVQMAAVPVSELPAQVRIVSEPPGATVLFDGTPVDGATPCTLPPAEPGTYSLVVGKSGYLDYRTTITIPAFGEAAFPVIRLQSEQPPAPREVELVFRSEPAAALLTINGVTLGKTPQTVKRKVGEELGLKLDHPGYYSLLRQLRVSDAPDQVPLLKLERQGADRQEGTARPERREPERKEPDRPVKAYGKLEVIAPDKTSVTCGEHKLGTTPLPSKTLPAGLHDCTFTLANHAPVSVPVEVKANFTSKVKVKF